MTKEKMDLMVVEKLDISDLENQIGGFSRFQCATMWAACVNDSVLAGLGCSDPASTCGFWAKWCHGVKS